MTKNLNLKFDLHRTVLIVFFNDIAQAFHTQMDPSHPAPHRGS